MKEESPLRTSPIVEVREGRYAPRILGRLVEMATIKIHEVRLEEN